MRLLIVAATDLEIRPLLQRLSPGGHRSGILNSYPYKDAVIDILVTGVGMLATAFHLGRTLSLNSYDFAINAGIAGAYSRDLQIGDVVEVTRDTTPEMGVQEGNRFISLYETGLTEADSYSFRRHRLENTLNVSLGSLAKLKKVNANTVNIIQTDREQIASLLRRKPAATESMEGAAFLYGCLVAGIPNAQVRAISNYVEERDKAKWNITLAAENLNMTIISVIDEWVNKLPDQQNI